MNAKKRNTEFVRLVNDTRNMPFGERLLELSAFARGAGCKFMFDADTFELRSTSSWCGKLLYSVPRD